MIKAGKTYFIIFLSFFSIFLFSQNLVPNPSFEYTVQCPSTVANITDCANWKNFGNTPDYFHSCAPSGVSVPSSQFGYQYANSGIAMSGLFTWVNPSSFPDYREFIGAQLTNTLQIGIKYYMSFYVNYAGWLSGWKQISSNKIGMRFSTVQSTSVNVAPINNFAHLKTNIVYSDTVNWLKISGSFIADSSYKYIVIGNFFNDLNTDTLSFSGTLFGSMGAYYYIDDVCVSTDSIFNAGWTNIASLKTSSEIKVFPNPANNFLFLDDFDQFNNFKLFDVIGNEIKFEVLKDKLDLSNLPSGVYFLFCTRDKEIYKAKILKK